MTAAAPPIRDALFHELLSIEVELRAAQGWQPDAGEYSQRFPDRTDQIRIVFESLLNEPTAKHQVEIPSPAGSGADSAVVAALDELPRQIGRYRIEKLAGQGGFGLVYKAHDGSLNRPVAIKVPHTALVTGSQDAKAYLTEAQTVAALDQAQIVPVYDVGSNEQFPCFVVSKYIEGISLATRLAQGRPGYRETVELVATMADALQYAHENGLIHRDVKPGNILIDRDGHAYLADFGLALRDGDCGGGPKYAGTPAYMSPEQARGEGHRLDGRSDVFSLGVVLYEMLTGRRPFRGSTQAELLERVTSWEPRPLRQYDGKLSVELERICLKAMSKRVSQRYSTAHDMAVDLRQFLAEDSGRMAGIPVGVTKVETANSTGRSSVSSAGSLREGSDSSIGLNSKDLQLTIVPKGLRSFDEHDADFFLELLPGVRDRKGLPESVQFWKTRIEETDPNKTFTVGLIYGPSGCGKSSLMKAGLLPRLSERVSVVYLEATANSTGQRLLHELQRHFSDLSTDLDLKDSLSQLRHERGLHFGQKVLIVLDQFEQWLSARESESNSGLVEALRQCDGEHVQCLVMVRDDFWLAVSRFMQDLEVDLVPGRNIALVDLFDSDHARRVLAAFGRAYGKFPENLREQSRQQKDFLTPVVLGLAQGGKVICVRLAIFAEMMKDKPWTSAALKEVGGTEGVGVTFLEETFNARSANPRHRLHQNAAQRVLKSLMPDAGSDIKGQMRSWNELLHASGYGANPWDFEDLIRILDSELRLITPTELELVAGDEWRVAGEGVKDIQDSKFANLPLIRPDGHLLPLPGEKGLLACFGKHGDKSFTALGDEQTVPQENATPESVFSPTTHHAPPLSPPLATTSSPTTISSRCCGSG